MALMRGMLLFWLIKKVTSASKNGWRSTRMQGAKSTHWARRGCAPRKVSSSAG
jgi:hypothetical protein